MVEDNLTDEQILAIIQSKATGKKLMSGTRINKEEAWSLLVKRYHAGLEKLAISKWHGNQDDADETLQNTWIKAFKKIDTVKGHFKGWIYTVLENQFTDEFRKKTSRDEKVPLVSIEARDPWDMDEDGERPGKVERKVNAIHSEQSAEEALFVRDEEGAHAGFIDLARRFLSKNDAEFFLKYQEESGTKSRAEKKKYFDYRSKLMGNMINEWLVSGRGLEAIMDPPQANALTRRFRLNQKQYLIFKEMGLTSKSELNTLLTGATSLLLQALMDKDPDAYISSNKKQ